jgi:hypothetical protein
MVGDLPLPLHHGQLLHHGPLLRHGPACPGERARERGHLCQRPAAMGGSDTPNHDGVGTSGHDATTRGHRA